MKPHGIFCLLCALLLIGESTHAQQWDWVQRFSSDSSGTAIGVDGNQNVYVAGTFTSTNYLGTNRFAVTNGSAVFLVKLNPDGEVIWAMTIGGSITRLAVATNGALFVVGDFRIPSDLRADSGTDDVHHVFVARVDGGKFTWFDTLPSEISGYAGGVAFAPDASVWVLAATNQVFFKKYDQNGNALNSITMDDTFFMPTGLAVNRDERLFVSGIAASNTWFGSNLVHYLTHFVAGIGNSGQPEWAWTPHYWTTLHRPNPVYGIACTPEGDLVQAGQKLEGMSWHATLTKFSPDGRVIWNTWKAFMHKSVFSANALAVDPSGNIHVTGLHVLHYLYPTQSDGLWIASYDSNGTRFAESTISNRRYSSWNVGNGIAVTPDGAIYITGKLTGSAFFGTNEVSETGGAFVARRSTLQPELISERVGENVILSWPRAAFPFALQQSDETGTNWNFVSQTPERASGRWQVIAPAEQASGTFRLFRTNEAPIRYPLRVQWMIDPDGTFLDHQSVVVLRPDTDALTRTFFARVSADGPGSRISFDAMNFETGEPVAPSRSLGVDAYIPLYSYVIVCYCTTVSSSAISFPPGRHKITLRISDGIDHFTNSVQFEVLALDTALQELRAALEPLAANRAGRHTVALFESALRAEDRERTKLAERRWRHFQRQLQRVTSTSEEERARLASAAQQIQTVLQSQ